MRYVPSLFTAPILPGYHASSDHCPSTTSPTLKDAAASRLSGLFGSATAWALASSITYTIVDRIHPSLVDSQSEQASGRSSFQDLAGKTGWPRTRAYISA